MDLVNGVSDFITKTNKQRLIRIINKCPWNVLVRAQSGDDDLGWKSLGYNQVYVFSFTPNIWGNTHFWATAKSEGRNVKFPLYNEGAPNEDNIFEMHDEGIHLKGALFRNWSLV